MKQLLLVGLGGFAGAVARWGLGSLVDRLLPDARFPHGIFVVNVVGCLAIGLYFGSAGTKPNPSETLRLLFAVGFLGAFTTFSTFSHNTLVLIQDGHPMTAFANIALSVLTGLGAVWLGFVLTR